MANYNTTVLKVSLLAGTASTALRLTSQFSPRGWQNTFARILPVRGLFGIPKLTYVPNTAYLQFGWLPNDLKGRLINTTDFGTTRNLLSAANGTIEQRFGIKLPRFGERFGLYPQYEVIPTSVPSKSAYEEGNLIFSRSTGNEFQDDMNIQSLIVPPLDVLPFLITGKMPGFSGNTEYDFARFRKPKQVLDPDYYSILLPKSNNGSITIPRFAGLGSHAPADGAVFENGYEVRAGEKFGDFNNGSVFNTKGFGIGSAFGLGTAGLGAYLLTNRNNKQE